LIGAAALAVLAMCHAAAADEIDSYLARQRTIYQVPALAVGIMCGGKLVDSRVVGISNVELQVPASSANAFEIGSISKQFTAYAILILYDNGKVDLDGPSRTDAIEGYARQIQLRRAYLDLIRGKPRLHA
jgi:CubicO group peptidase (beta-lactamase class C family)